VVDLVAIETPDLRDDFDIVCLVVSLLLDVFDWCLVVLFLLRELLVLDRARTSVYLSSSVCNFIA